MSLASLVSGVLPRGRQAPLGIIPILVAGMVWEFLSALGLIPIPRLSQVLRVLATCLMSPEFLSAFLTTFVHLLIGIAIASSIAVALGILSGLSETLDSMLMPPVLVVGVFPDPLIWIWLVFWLGTGPLVIILVSVINSVFPMFLLVREAMKSIPSSYFEIATTFGASRLAILTHIILPMITVSIVNGVRVGLCSLWEIVLATEIVTGIRGFGSFVAGAQPVAVALASVLLMIIVTVGLDNMLLRRIEVKLRAMTAL